MPQPVLPTLEHNDTTSRLPADPAELLTDEQHRELNEGLARIAEIRRKAEASSANLQMA